jgi:hypothetical protein
MNWTDIVKTLGSVAIGSGAIAFVLRSIWSQLLSRDLEKFKADLENRNNVEVERLRTELKKVAFEHETRYAKLHERRAEVLEELFKRLVRANDAFASRFRAVQFAGEASSDEKTRRASELANQFIDYYIENRLFIDKPLAEKIDAVNRHFQNVWMTLDPVWEPKERYRVVSEFFANVPALLDEIRDRIIEMLSPSKIETYDRVTERKSEPTT